MFRSVLACVVVAFCCVLPASSQTDPSSFEGFFTGKMVVARIDLPGSEKGVDLSYNKPSPMDWKEYSSRLTAFGVAIHKGDEARITKVVVKNDRIEFHLDGGGFGSFGDDTNTTVTPIPVAKSQREKDLRSRLPTRRTRGRSATYRRTSTTSARGGSGRKLRIGTPRWWPAR